MKRKAEDLSMNISFSHYNCYAAGVMTLITAEDVMACVFELALVPHTMRSAAQQGVSRHSQFLSKTLIAEPFELSEVGVIYIYIYETEFIA